MKELSYHNHESTRPVDGLQKAMSALAVAVAVVIITYSLIIELFL